MKIEKTTATARRLAALCAIACCALLGPGAAQAIAATPTVVNTVPYPITPTTATLNGTVATDSALTECHFEYVDPVAVGDDTSFSDLSSGGTIDCATSDGGPIAEPGEVPADSSAHVVSAVLPRPTPSAPYYYRLVATNASGTTAGSNWRGFGFGVPFFDATVLEESGEPDTEAGGRPFSATTEFTITSTVGDNGTHLSTETLRDAIFKIPPGLVANPQANPQCRYAQLATNDCPAETQVGVVEVRVTLGATLLLTWKRGIFNLEPPYGTPALFGFNILNNITNVIADVRTGEDYGATVTVTNNPEVFDIREVNFELWGVPADPAHDADRFVTGKISTQGSTSSAPLNPYLSLPTSCIGTDGVPGDPLRTDVELTSWQGSAGTNSVLSHDNTEPEPQPIGISGCNAVPFDPTLEARPTTNVADSPSGLDVDLHVPQSELCEGGRVEEEGEEVILPVNCEAASAHLKDTTVVLPPGMTVNPAGANGLGACSEAQFGFTSKEGDTIHTTPDPASCPDSAKLGTVQVQSPLLDHPIDGSVYIATPYANPFNSLIAIYITANDAQTGIAVKLAGEVHADPNTGQLTATVLHNPELPFEDFRLHFFGGAAGSLRTPATCGTYSTDSSMVPWTEPEGETVSYSDPWAIQTAPGGGACPTSAAAMPNSPDLDAGSISPVAGIATPTVVNLHRPDGTQEFSSLSLTLPPGLTGRLAGVSYCPDAALAAAAAKSGRAEEAAPSCPATSRIGSVYVAAGAGPAPYNTVGTAYLTGPYKGAPLGMAIITPATAGPFDLGTVVVRVALYLNQSTGQITAVSDTIPHILKGIPLDVRSARVLLDRQNFTRNGTSCDPSAFSGALVSTLNQAAPLSERFQLGECSALAFKPKLGIRLFGGTKRGAHPRLRGVVVMPEGGANIAQASVALPRSEFLDQAHIGTVCTRVQFAAGDGNGSACPPASIYGRAVATSPLVDYTLEGNAYLRSSNHKLPDLVVALHGPPSQPVQVDVVGRIDSFHRGIRTTFEAVPDLPVSRFVLNMKGGRKGLLQNSTNICRRKYRATALFDGQNGKGADRHPLLRNGKCRKQRRHKRKHRRHARASALHFRRAAR